MLIVVIITLADRHGLPILANRTTISSENRTHRLARSVSGHHRQGMLMSALGGVINGTTMFRNGVVLTYFASSSVTLASPTQS